MKTIDALSLALIIIGIALVAFLMLEAIYTLIRYLVREQNVGGLALVLGLGLIFAGAMIQIISHSL